MIESGIHLRICSCPTGTFLDRYLSLWFLSGSPVSDELQSFWYMSVLLSDRALTKASVVERSQKAKFWLHWLHTAVSGS